MEKKFLIVANWKANQVDVKRWIDQLLTFCLQLVEKGFVDIVVAPPFTQISAVADSLKANSYQLPAKIASQDISMHPIGAYTGEIPGQLLKDLAVEYCLIGHSERRRYFKETNREVEKKMERAINVGITPIICAQTLEEIPTNVRNYPADKYVVMYEPMEAISTEGQYHAEPPDRVEAMLEEWKSKLNLQGCLLYGGSVNPDNVASFATLPLISGFVVGHASLDPEEFFSIIKRCLPKETSR